jgi:hypothetical protein
VTESPSEDRELYTLRRTYYVNNSSNDVRKVICTLLGKLEKYKLGHSLVSIEFISQYKQI